MLNEPDIPPARLERAKQRVRDLVSLRGGDEHYKGGPVSGRARMLLTPLIALAALGGGVAHYWLRTAGSTGGSADR